MNVFNDPVANYMSAVKELVLLKEEASKYQTFLLRH